MSYKTNYAVTPDGELRPLTVNELMHWKYVKREKVGDKWRYWYDEDEEQTVAAELNDLATQIEGRYRQAVTKVGDDKYRYTYYETETGGAENSVYDDRKGMTKLLKDLKNESERQKRIEQEKEQTKVAKRTIKIAKAWIDDNLDALFGRGEYVPLDEVEDRVRKVFPGLFD